MWVYVCNLLLFLGLMARGKQFSSLQKRLILNLRDGDGWTFDKIAKSLGSGKSAIRKAYKRAINPKQLNKVGKHRKTDSR